ncbi:hypothetical protein J2S22_005666 [Rhodoplanes tepidamans]|nr:hypothetical protein [Rhodoplanes tepidamans]
MARLFIAAAALALLASTVPVEARRLSDQPNSCYLNGKRYRVCPTLRAPAQAGQPHGGLRAIRSKKP